MPVPAPIWHINCSKRAQWRASGGPEERSNITRQAGGSCRRSPAPLLTTRKRPMQVFGVLTGGMTGLNAALAGASGSRRRAAPGPLPRFCGWQRSARPYCIYPDMGSVAHPEDAGSGASGRTARRKEMSPARNLKKLQSMVLTGRAGRSAPAPGDGAQINSYTEYFLNLADWDPAPRALRSSGVGCAELHTGRSGWIPSASGN